MYTSIVDELLPTFFLLLLLLHWTIRVGVAEVEIETGLVGGCWRREGEMAFHLRAERPA